VRVEQTVGETRIVVNNAGLGKVRVIVLSPNNMVNTIDCSDVEAIALRDLLDAVLQKRN